MPLKHVVLMRHAERLDRFEEISGRDWISSAERPQDTPITERGRLQAEAAGRILLGRGIRVVKIFASPTIRCVMTSHEVARVHGVSRICIEQGLVECAKDMRGRSPGEKQPNWNPLVLDVAALSEHSPLVAGDCESLVKVTHERDPAVAYNEIREVCPTGSRDPAQVFSARCARTIRAIVQTCITEFADTHEDVAVLCVGHGASIGRKGCASALQAGLAPELTMGLTEETDHTDYTSYCVFELADLDPALPGKPVDPCWQSAHLDELGGRHG